MQIEYFHLLFQTKTSKTYYTFTAELKSPSPKIEKFQKILFFQKNQISFAGEILPAKTLTFTYVMTSKISIQKIKNVC